MRLGLTRAHPDLEVICPKLRGILQQIVNSAEKMHRWPADDLYGEHFELCQFEGLARTCESEVESSVALSLP